METKDLDVLNKNVEKTAEALKAVSEKLKTAKEELAATPDDDKLKKKVEGLIKAEEAAMQKAQEAIEALRQAEEKSRESSKGGGAKVRLRCKSKTGKPSYYRAGLLFRPNEQEYEVSQEIAEILAADQWLEVSEVK